MLHLLALIVALLCVDVHSSSPVGGLFCNIVTGTSIGNICVALDNSDGYVYCYGRADNCNWLSIFGSNDCNTDSDCANKYDSGSPRYTDSETCAFIRSNHPAGYWTIPACPTPDEKALRSLYSNNGGSSWTVGGVTVTGWSDFMLINCASPPTGVTCGSAGACAGRVTEANMVLSPGDVGISGAHV